MKKMYNNPKTEAVELNGDMLMQAPVLTVSPGGPQDNLPDAAPMRHVGSLGPSY